MQEGGVALLPELLVLLTLHAAHPLHHLLAQLHWRRQRLGVATQDVAEVDVEELPCNQEQEHSRIFAHANAYEQCEGGKPSPDLSL